MNNNRQPCICSNAEEANTTDPRPMVAVVVPAFNEAGIIEKNLTILCQYMETLEDLYRWELIVVDDGSSDNTGDMAEAFARERENVRVLHHPLNFRLGQALRYAFSQCKGDYVVVMDLDLSYAPDHIGKMLAKIRQTRAKIVIASPYMKGGKVSNVPWLRRKLSVWANRFLCLTATRDRFSDKLTTITGMVRAYDGEFLSKLNLRSMDVEINSEIIYKAMILRARIVEIPSHLNWGSQKVKKGESPGAKRKSSMRILRSIIQSILSGFIFRPFMFFIVPGMISLMFSLYSFYFVFRHIITTFATLSETMGSINFRIGASVGVAFDNAPHAFVISGIALMIAIQLFSLGLQCLQKKRYYEEMFHLSSTIYNITKENNKQCIRKS